MIGAGSVIGAIRSYQPFPLDTPVADDTQSLSIRNDGQILGEVRMYIGDDLFDSRLGTVGGRVYGYAGNDTIMTGAGDDWLDGGAGGDRAGGRRRGRPARRRQRRRCAGRRRRRRPAQRRGGLGCPDRRSRRRLVLRRRRRHRGRGGVGRCGGPRLREHELHAGHRGLYRDPFDRLSCRHGGDRSWRQRARQRHLRQCRQQSHRRQRRRRHDGRLRRRRLVFRRPRRRFRPGGLGGRGGGPDLRELELHPGGRILYRDPFDRLSRGHRGDRS